MNRFDSFPCRLAYYLHPFRHSRIQTRIQRLTSSPNSKFIANSQLRTYLSCVETRSQAGWLRQITSSPVRSFYYPPTFYADFFFSIFRFQSGWVSFESSESRSQVLHLEASLKSTLIHRGDTGTFSSMMSEWTSSSRVMCHQLSQQEFRTRSTLVLS